MRILSKSGVLLKQNYIIDTPIKWHFKSEKRNTLKIIFKKGLPIKYSTTPFIKGQYDYILPDEIEISQIKGIVLIKK